MLCCPCMFSRRVRPFYQMSVGNSIYNSLQVKLTHRISYGLQVQGAYTWAHGIDDSTDPIVPAAGNRDSPVIPATSLKSAETPITTSDRLRSSTTFGTFL